MRIDHNPIDQWLEQSGAIYKTLVRRTEREEATEPPTNEPIYHIKNTFMHLTVHSIHEMQNAVEPDAVQTANTNGLFYCV